MEILSAFLPWIQIVLSALLVLVILFQQNEAGLGSAFGGGNTGGGFRQKRGLEKQLFVLTIILAVLFILSTLMALFV